MDQLINFINKQKSIYIEPRVVCKSGVEETMPSESDACNVECCFQNTTLKVNKRSNDSGLHAAEVMLRKALINNTSILHVLSPNPQPVHCETALDCITVTRNIIRL